MWIVLAILVLASGTGAWLLFQMACSRTGGPLGRLLPLLLHSDGNPIDAHSEVIEQGKAWHAAQNWESVSIQSHDGLTLRGAYLPHPQAKRAILCVHGYHGSAERDFSGAMADFYAMGSSLLLIDQRAHGKSEGRYTTFGVLERKDVQAWAQYYETRTGGAIPMVLDGISMGAATVLMAGELDMPPSVSGVIADCGYTAPVEQLHHVVENMLHAKAFPALQLVRGMARLQGGFSLSGASARKGAAAWERPVLFVHGLSDTFVPPWMSEENFKACKGPKDIYLVEGAEHGLSYLVDKAGVSEKLSHLFAAADRYFDENHAKKR
ncbi:MAG: alpha/beta hydrolase [Clostridia bacterium]|nr:alpha/beta hydrolase [Clostridia bacterium]